VLISTSPVRAHLGEVRTKARRFDENDPIAHRSAGMPAYLVDVDQGRVPILSPTGHN
jgi:hypothetical protein